MFRVIVKPSGAEAWLPCGSPLTELDLELHGQNRIPFGCRAGACGACLIEVLEGLSNLSNKEEAEEWFLESLGFPDEKFRLACQCHLNGEVMLRVVTT